MDEIQTFKELNEIYIIYFMRGLISCTTSEEFISHHMSKIRMQGKGYWLAVPAVDYVEVLKKSI